MAVLLLLLTPLLLNIQSGNTDEGAVHMNVGDKAPYEGYEITPAQAAKVRNQTIDLSLQQHLNSNLTQENALMGERITNAQQQNDRLSKELVETKDNSFFSKAGFFVLGSLVTGAIAYGVYRSK